MSTTPSNPATVPTILAHALSWDPDDQTLSGSEAGLCRIMHAVTADIDRLDGSQVSAVARWLVAVASETIAVERAGLASLGIIVDEADVDGVEEPDFG